MKSSLPLLTGLIILSQSILSVSAAVPTSPPSSSAAPAGGYFSQYFSNMIQSAPCSVGNVLTGFTTTAGVNYGVRQCTSVKSLLASIYGSSPAPANTVFDGFYSNGDIRYSPSIWLKSGTNLSYTGGNLGIGTSTPTAKLEVNGNIIANTPTAANHVATKAYVDSKGTAVTNINNLPTGSIAGNCVKSPNKWIPATIVYPAKNIANQCGCDAGWTSKKTGSDYCNGVFCGGNTNYYTCIKN